jgi:hypothetical protein
VSGRVSHEFLAASVLLKQYLHPFSERCRLSMTPVRWLNGHPYRRKSGFLPVSGRRLRAHSKIESLPERTQSSFQKVSIMYDDEPESIYSLIPKPPPVVIKEPLYVSRHAGSTAFDTVKKRPHATMGEPLDVFRRDPKDFLQKRARCRDLPPKPDSPRRPRDSLARSPVPRQREIPQTPQRQKRDFVLENWRNAPKTPQLHPPVQKIHYTEKRDYGKTPKYLKRVQQEAANEAAYWDDVRETMMPRPSEPHCRLLSEDDRLEILRGLQANLADVRKRYAALPLGQDTLSFRKRKEAMEAQMAQLEADISAFSRRSIYVTEE